VVKDDRRAALAHAINMHFVSIHIDQNSRRRISALVGFGSGSLVNHASYCQHKGQDGKSDKTMFENIQYPIGTRLCIHSIFLFN
jgi:hypothetical protein